MPAQTVIKVRRDIAANWTSVDPTLASGEIGFETDTNQLKVGNGTDEWTVLPYASGAGGASVEISTTAPADPEEGDVWFNSTEGRAYIYYDSFWVDLNPGIAGPPGATGETGVAIQDAEPASTDVLWLDTDEEPDVPVPAGGTEGQVLAKSSATDYDSEWVDLPTPAPAPSGNVIINGAFEINQRGFTSSTVAGYGFDRWLFGFIGDGTTTYSAQTFTPGSAPVAGYEAGNHARLVSSGQTTNNAASLLDHRIEEVRTFAGQTVTFSFFAKAGSGTPKVSIELTQNFGSGGSANVNTFVQQFTLSTSWQRFSATVAVPSIAGKTLGAGSFLQVRTWVSAGPDFNARTSSLGIQSNTFDIWGVQLEAGSTATPFRRNANSLQGELAACQRYYYRITPGVVSGTMGFGSAQATTLARLMVPFPVTMRTRPTALEQNGTANNYAVLQIGVGSTTCSGVPIFSQASDQMGIVRFEVASGLTQFFPCAANTDPTNGATAFLGWSAEL